MSTSVAELVTLRDIADLARVQRPVVSMWRRRSAAGSDPFPSSTAAANGQEVFPLESVVDWLERTGRGNNPAAREDASAAASLDLLPAAEQAGAFHGLAALLALKADLAIELGGLTAGDLLELADQVDPHDLCLFREIEALGGEAPGWADHADALASAAFTPAAAIELLEARAVRSVEIATHPRLAPAMAELLVRLVAELDAAAVYTSHEATQVLVEVGRRAGEPGTAVLPLPDSAEDRQARRRLLAAGWRVSSLEPSAAVAPGSLLLAISLPRDGDLNRVLEHLSEAEASLPGDARAVVVGPASALCDRLPAPGQAHRATVLRSGRVHAVVRLPAGQLPAHPRERLGLWLLGPGDAGRVREADHLVAAADLSGGRLDPATIGDLVQDLLAAALSAPGRRGHAFRFARLIPTTTLIAASGSLVDVHPPSHRLRSTASELATSIEAGFLAAGAGAVLEQWQVRPGEVEGAAVVTLGRLVTSGAVRVVPGNRLDPADLDQSAGAVVHSAETLESCVTSQRISRATLAQVYPAARETRPGDVVWCSAPRPWAVVDREGLGVVATPARVLRLTPRAPDGLTPEVLASAIRSAHGVDWRRWSVPLVPASQVSTLETALASVAHARAAAVAQLAALDRLSTQLVEAVSSGGVTLLPPRHTPMEG